MLEQRGEMTLASWTFPASLEPVGDGIEVDREAGKLAHRFIVSIRRHGHEVGRAADVDAGGMGMGDRRSGLA